MAASEGYRNVGNFSENFDDLDLEGSVIDEWNEHDSKLDNKGNHVGAVETPEISYLLKNCTVKLDNGSHGFVFSAEYDKGIPQYQCHICNAFMGNSKMFNGHVSSKRHCTNLQKPSHANRHFTRIVEETSVELQPGEPAPPGMEDMIEPQKCFIQQKLDSYKTGPLLGLEYLIELVYSRNDEPDYYCLMCHKQGITNNILVHLTCQAHNHMYLEKFFPRTYRAICKVPKLPDYRKGLSIVTVQIAKKIESKYGRLRPKQYSGDSFKRTKGDLYERIEKEYHFRENPGDNYENMVDVEEIKALQFSNDDDRSVVKLQTDPVVGERAKKKDGDNKGLFNKGKINVDKRQLRKDIDVKGEKVHEPSRSDDVIIIDDEDSTKGGQGQIQPIKEVRETEKMEGSLSPVSAGSIGDAEEDLKKKKLTSRSKIRSGSRNRSRSPHDHDTHYRRSSRSRSPSSVYKRGRRSPFKGRSRSPFASRSGHYRSHRSRSRSPYGRRRSRSSSRPSYHSGRDYRDRELYYRDHPDRNRDSRPRLPYPPRRRSSRSRSPSQPSRSPSRFNRCRYYRPEVAPPPLRSERDREDIIAEKHRWDKFKEDLKILHDKLKFHEKNPEKHPQYSVEWKMFWNRRYKELQTEGKDPAKHDFKPEWISYWNKRMKELYEEEVKEVKDKFNERPSADVEHSMKEAKNGEENTDANKIQKDVTVDDIKNTWKALTGSDIKETVEPYLKHERSLDHDRPLDHVLGMNVGMNKSNLSNLRMPPGARIGFIPTDDGAPKVISVLRLLTVLEGTLGSLGPKVISLLSKTLLMEKSCPHSSEDILYNEEDCVLFETVREKLKGLLFAGLVERHLVNTTRICLKNIEDLMSKAPKVFKKAENLTHSLVSSSKVAPHPIAVTGIGTVDRVAIAEQIATALIQQGRFDVSEQELEGLIDEVVASSNRASASAAATGAAEDVVNQYVADHGAPQQEMKPFKATNVGGLSMLQSAYGEGEHVDHSKEDKDRLSGFSNSQPLVSSVNVITDLPDYDLRVLLENFTKLRPHDQKKLIEFLKKLESTAPERITNLNKQIDFQTLLTSGVNPCLSPFSSRMGSANPTAEEEKPKHKFDSLESSQKSKSSVIGDDDDNDDDDDDYSYEEIYKAASEKVRQQQFTTAPEESVTERSKAIEEDAPCKIDDDISFEGVYKAPEKKMRLENKEIENNPEAQVNQELPCMSNDKLPSQTPLHNRYQENQNLPSTNYPIFYRQPTQGTYSNNQFSAEVYRNDRNSSNFPPYKNESNLYPQENRNMYNPPRGSYPPDGQDFLPNPNPMANNRFTQPSNRDNFTGGHQKWPPY